MPYVKEQEAYNFANDFREKNIQRKRDPIIDLDVVEITFLRPVNCSASGQFLDYPRVR